MITIGEAANLSGVSAKMIRKYEESELIPKAKRTDGGYRIYSKNDIHTLKFIKHSRQLGFSMAEIKELLSLWKNKRRKSAKVKEIASKHIKDLNQKKNEIEQMLSTLTNLVRCCHGDDRPDCPILEKLENY